MYELLIFKGKLLETDKAIVYCAVTPDDSPLAQALKEHHKNIEQATGTPLVLGGQLEPNGEAVIAESVDTIKSAEIQVTRGVGFLKPKASFSPIFQLKLLRLQN